MKRGGVINDKLSYAIATMGHDDLMIVTDAGMPFKRDERTIDLALSPNVPDVFSVLRAIRQEMWVERFAFIEEGRNPNVVNGVTGLFPDAESLTMPNDWFHEAVDNTAKWVVRSGAWTPWGNVALWSGIPFADWSASTGTEPPEDWQEKIDKNRRFGKEGVE